MLRFFLQYDKKERSEKKPFISESRGWYQVKKEQEMLKCNYIRKIQESTSYIATYIDKELDKLI